ncbi:GntR family transcriptional regulator [Pseudomonas cichorii]|uniref:Transcriptional regulator, GntR protein n=1 Tax=Pseudomonas cichorii TaxID=36746 RepID=A0A3M4VYI3_PSECI|nr:Transcriptional regulator, GntR protein [Pseudomonas cichorii]GFM75781.1 GntR family transcriptional regulator [Pseudomonas cichorii]
MREDVPRAVTTICNALQEQIEHGLLPSGSKLPAERKLSEVFDTTRITLREALVQLEAQGLIYREERRGWFVSPPRLAYDLIRRSHFHAMVQAQGRVAETQIISARLQPASAKICEKLQLPALSSVIQICRARRIDQRLVLYVEHYLNPEYFPGILDCDLSQSLTELYASRYDLSYGQVHFEIVPTALHADACAALKVSVGSPGLCIARVNYDQRGRLIDCDLEYWRHDAIHVSAVAGDFLSSLPVVGDLKESVSPLGQVSPGGEPLLN